MKSYEATQKEVDKLRRRGRIEALKALCTVHPTRRLAHKREAARCFELAARIERLEGPVIEHRTAANACQR